ncbi:MAG: hypothetical protein ACXVBQ_16495 [Pseudobdellovibrionaceae bacterium]
MKQLINPKNTSQVVLYAMRSLLAQSFTMTSQDINMKITIPTPKFEINKRMVSPIEIDMWNIQGQYEDGKWHELIHACVQRLGGKKPICRQSHTLEQRYAQCKL